jgi:hypothetical protein
VIELAVMVALAAPARLGVRADEFSFVLSRQSLKAGAAILQLENDGEDAHDLRLRREGGVRVLRVPSVKPGGVAELETTLARGRYRLWCSIADHRARGMSAELVVR